MAGSLFLEKVSFFFLNQPSFYGFLKAFPETAGTVPGRFLVVYYKWSKTILTGQFSFWYPLNEDPAEFYVVVCVRSRRAESATA